MARIILGFVMLVSMVALLAGIFGANTSIPAGNSSTVNRSVQTQSLAKSGPDSQTLYSANIARVTTYNQAAPAAATEQIETNAVGQVVSGVGAFLGGLHGVVKAIFQIIQSSPASLDAFWGTLELLTVLLVVCGFLHLAWEKAILRRPNRI